MEYKSGLAKDIDDSVNAGMGTVRQEFRAADGELRSSISEEISQTETRVTEGYGEAVEAEKKRAEGAESGLSGDISGEVKRAKDAESAITETLTQTEKTLNSKIDQTAGEITLAVEEQISETKTEVTKLVTDETERAKGAESGLSGEIDELGKTSETHTKKLSELDVSVGGISATVTEQTETITEQGTRIEKAEAAIEETAGKIDLKVSKGDVSSQLSLEGGDVSIKGNRLSVESDNFKLSKNGEVEASGTFTSEGSGYTALLGSGKLEFKYGSNPKVVLYAMDNLTSTFMLANGILFYVNDTEYVDGMLFDRPYVAFYPNGGVYITGSLTARGGKQRVVSTPNFGDVGLSAMESCFPVFSDIGRGMINESGEVMITLDPIFAETIDENCSYCVFIQDIGEGRRSYVSEKNRDSFCVKGTPGREFDWIIYAIQRDYQNTRLNVLGEDLPASAASEYSSEEYMKEILEEEKRAVDAAFGI